MILGRLAGMLGPEVANRAMFIAPTRVAKIFVWSDVATFVVQAFGGSMLTSYDADKQNLGNKVVSILPPQKLSGPRPLSSRSS